MRLSAFLVALVLFVTVPPAQAAESAYDRVMRTGVIRCGFVPWPPGFEVDPNTNEVRGPTKELFESIIGLTGWKTEFVQVTLGNVALDLNNGRIDAMCGDGPWTIASIRLVDYTTWAAYMPVFVYVRADDARFNISSDLATLRFPKATLRTLINLTDPAQMLMEVATGKADAVILDPVTADSFIRNNPGKIKQLPAREPLAVYPLGMSVRRGESALQQTLSRATEMALNIGLIDQKLDLYDPTRRTVYTPARSYTLPQEN